MAFWPSMGKDIEDRVNKCAVCNSTKAHQQKEPLHLYPVPDTPWSLVAAADLMTWDSKQYLVLVDSYSGWWEVNYLAKVASGAVITKLKSHFGREGSPQILSLQARNLQTLLKHY